MADASKVSASTKRRKVFSPREFITQYSPSIRDGHTVDKIARMKFEESEAYTRSNKPLNLIKSPNIQSDSLSASEQCVFCRRGPCPFCSESRAVGQSVPRAVPWVAIRRSWIADQLRRAGKANHPEAFKMLLMELIDELECTTPKGVFTPFPKTLGAPKKSQTQEIYQTWIQKQKPSWAKLAVLVFGKKFLNAKPSEQHRLRNLCRSAVERRKAKLATQV